MKKFILGAFLALSSLTLLANLDSNLSLRITDPSYRLLNLAIPEFSLSNKGSSLKNLSEKMRSEFNSLSEYSGVFRIVKEEAYSDFETTIQQKNNTLSDFHGTDFSQWKNLGIEVLIKAEMKSEFLSTKISIEAFDTMKSRKILTVTNASISFSSYKKLAKRVLDALQQYYTKLPGPFTEKIVFVGQKKKNSAKQIYTCNIDGSDLKQITDNSYLKLSPAWGPENKKIIYTSYRKNNPDLYIRGLSLFSKPKVLSSFEGINSGGIYDHVGNNIIYTGSSENSVDLYSLNLKSGKRNRLTFGTRNINVDPHMSKDGEWLTYVTDAYGNPHVMVAKVNRFSYKGEPRISLGGHKRLTFTGWYNTMPSWSPDGKEIIYASYDKGDKRFDLFKFTNEGKNVIRLTSYSGNNESPSWSPNGRTLVFHSNRETPSTSTFHLYVMNKDGSNQRKIKLDLYSARNPKWGN